MKYKTILADPPWMERGGGKIKRGADRHYPLMKTKDIIAMKSFIFNLADKNCHLYLWVTNNFIPDGLQVMKWWGFRYITTISWVKMVKQGELFTAPKNQYTLQQPGLGQYFRGLTEHCLFGTKGKTLLPEHKAKTVIFAPRKRHSEKPYQIFTYAELVSPEPRIELFARKEREGWDSRGDEIE